MDHVNSVLAHCLGVKAAYFGSYLSRWYEKDAILECLCVRNAQKSVLRLHIRPLKAQMIQRRRSPAFKFPKLLILDCGFCLPLAFMNCTK